MDTAYIYSVTRVRTLATALITNADIERLLAATTGEALKQALLDSYLALYIPDSNTWTIDDILEEYELQAVQLVQEITPDSAVLYGHLARYDFHNIRVLSKARTQDLDQPETLSCLSPLGRFPQRVIYEHAMQNTLYGLASELHEAYRQACWHLEAKEVDRAELAIDQAYWKYRCAQAELVDDLFVRSLLAIEIDLHNVSVRLRTETVDHFDWNKAVQPGGSFGVGQFSTIEGLSSVLQTYGGIELWSEALAHATTGSFLELEQASRRYIQAYVHQASYDMFSVAGLLHYLLAVENSSNIVRTIVTGQQSGQSVTEIRKRLTGLVALV